MGTSGRCGCCTRLVIEKEGSGGGDCKSEGTMRQEKLAAVIGKMWGGGGAFAGIGGQGGWEKEGGGGSERLGLGRGTGVEHAWDTAQLARDAVLWVGGGGCCSN
jgi:hypothetical protein